MVVYGVALLALCLLLGTYLGNVLGYIMGIDANVGGVGIAMLMLIVLSNLSHSKFHLKPMTESGIHFWSAMYIPIVVAMAAKQNVVAALSSGWLAVIAGVGAVVVSFALVPVLTKLGGSDTAPLTDKES
jgi:malonate transporter MadL subunit